MIILTAEISISTSQNTAGRIEWPIYPGSKTITHARATFAFAGKSPAPIFYFKFLFNSVRLE